MLHIGSRRWFLQVNAAGLAGLPWLSAAADGVESGTANRPAGDAKAVILFWLSGGPSQLDMWDPKPTAPREVRGPYGVISTRLPGVQFCEHLPLQASIADQLSILRSVDCSASNHTPITMQAGNPLAQRTNDGNDGGGYPSMGSVAARYRGANDPHLPPFVGLADSWAADVWGAGHLGSQFAPVQGNTLAGKFALPEGVHIERLRNREALRQELARLGRQVDAAAIQGGLGRHSQRAYEMVLSGRIREALDVDRESDALRDEYGRESIGEKALLARRLVEAGVTFVLVSGAWGYFDHHGDDVRWGGIEKGLTPLLPRIDRVLYALVKDLEQRGRLDSTLILMMGEFGRTPKINEQAGRHHWLPVMSMLMAGGGLRHGQVIGATDRHGGAIAERPVRPQDLAATVYRYLGIDLDTVWRDPAGRPNPIVTAGGEPIAELF